MSFQAKRPRFYAARLGVEDTFLEDDTGSALKDNVEAEVCSQGASGEEVGVRRGLAESPRHDPINEQVLGTTTSCSHQSGLLAQAQPSVLSQQHQEGGEEGRKQDSSQHQGIEHFSSGLSTLDVETPLTWWLRGGGSVVGSGEVSSAETLRSLPCPTILIEQGDEQELHDFTRRRRSFIVDGYVGLKLNAWVTLGHDLWSRGVTLGLEKFLPPESIDSLQGEEPVQRSDIGERRAHSPQLVDVSSAVTTPPVEGEWNLLPWATGPVTAQLPAPTSPGGGLRGIHDNEPPPSIVPSSGQTPRIPLRTGPDLSTRLASAISAIQSSALQPCIHYGQQDSSSGLQLAAPMRLSLSELHAGKGELSHGWEDPHVALSAGQVHAQSLKRKFLEAGTGLVHRTVGREMRNQVRDMLHLAAKALEDKDSPLFRRLRSRLQPYVKQRGQGWERAAYCLLHSLTLREHGQGPAVLRRRLGLTIKEMSRCLIWMFMGMPLCPFAVICTIGTLLPVLLGKPHVHIINFGEVMVPKLSTLLKLLCGGTRKSRLKSFRLTHVRAFPLCRPGRPEFETVQPAEVVASMVHRTAEELGVEFSFQGIILKEDCLSLLDRVRRSPHEAVGVCSALELKFFSEEVGDVSGSSLHKLQACITRLQPDVLSFVEEDIDASCPHFPSRFASWQEFLWSLYEGGDGCTGEKGVKLLHDFEDTYWRQVCRSVVGCEGRERRWRPKSGEQQEQVLHSCGMQQGCVPGSVVERVQEIVGVYPEGWAVMEERCGLNLLFKGTKILRSTTWSWSRSDCHVEPATYH